jgi:Tyrosyl-tRNA synthetase
MGRTNNFDFISIMIERGFLHQVTDIENLQKEMLKNPIVGYIGFDCTAPSLHVGSLIQIMMLRWFQKTGNKPIVLMGGGTTKVGDPSGKDSARPLLSNKK